MCPCIELDHLEKRFGETIAVRGLSLRVERGEVVGLLGPNGAGKTTALRMLAGLLTPTSGRVEVCGIEVTERPLEARRRLGFMTASTGVYPRLSARELLETFGRLQGLDAVEVARRIARVSEELGLGAFLDQRCGTLSSGQRQRVSIARAILHDPDAYVLDEPTAALDPLAARAILEVVREARGRGKAVLFSTHRMEEAEYLCDRICFLRAGRLVAEGSPAQLRADSGEPTLTGAFLRWASAPEPENRRPS